MKSHPTLRRWVAALTAFAVLGVVVAVAALTGGNPEEKVDKKKYPWPLFGGTVQRNLVNLTDMNIPLDFAVDPGQEKRLKWSQPLGTKSYGGPVVAEGKIFIGTNNEKPRDPKVQGDHGVIMCFDANTGEFLWQNAYPKLPAGRVNDWPLEGICSTPVVENGKLYYVSNRCEVVCAETATGKHVWTLDMMKELDVFPHNLATCSPLIVGDTIFVCTSNGVDEGHINIPAPRAPSFIAVNKTNGKVIWQNNAPTENLLRAPGVGNQEAFIKQLVNSGKLLMHGQWANPCYAEIDGQGQIIFPGGDGWLRAFNPADGKLLWKFDCNPKDSVYKLSGEGTRNDFVNTPVIYDNYLYIGVGQDPEHDEGVGHFWAVDLVKATRLGKTNPDNDVSPVKDRFDPKAPENAKSALAWHYGGLATEKTKIPFSAYTFGRTLSTACAHDGLVYIPELHGVLHCLDAKTGERQWYHDFEAPIWSSPYYVDGKILMGTDDGYLYAFRAGREKELVKDFEMYGKIRATPVVANGVMYVMTENQIYAID